MADDASVTVDLREGFTGQAVRLGVPGMAPVLIDAARTRMQIGRAWSQVLPVPAGRVSLRVELPASGVAQQVELPSTRPLWVGVSLARSGDRLECVVQAEPFRYA